MATIKQIAEAAGVSIATVSHVINGTRYVSDELKQRVRAAMTDLDYLPNQMARSLRAGRTRIIGLIAPDFSDPYFAEIGTAIEKAAYQDGYSVIFCSSERDFSKEKAYIDDLISKKVDGIIFITLEQSDEELFRLLDQKIPVLLVDERLPGIAADCVSYDFEHGGYLATRHLLEFGHQKIACALPTNTRVSFLDRLAGYRRALEEQGIHVPEDYIICTGHSIEEGKQAMKHLMALADSPSAIFYTTDMMAFGGMIAARELKLNVPEDISIVGFDNISWAKQWSPPLTTVDKKISKMGAKSVELLLRKINNTEDRDLSEAIDIVIKPDLVIRQSCAEYETILSF